MDGISAYLFLAFVGILVGVVSAALGIGGGTLMVPAFIIVFPEMDLNTAKGSSLLIITFVAAYNSFKMNRGDMKSPWRVIGLVAAGSLIGGYVGAWLTTLADDQTVAWIFIALLGFAAFRTFFLDTPTVTEEHVQRRGAMSTGIGVGTGVVSGATGTGGGAVLVPMALWAGIVSNERVVALSNTVMIATCASGTLAHAMGNQTFDMPWTYGLVNVAFAPVMVVPALIAAPLGRWINERLTLSRRRVVMGILLLLIALRLLGRALG